MQHLKHMGLAALMTVSLCGGVLAQAATYHVTIQAPASSATRPDGTLIFEFNGGAGALSAAASISNLAFSSDYQLDGDTVFGNASTGGQGTTAFISNDPTQVNGFFTDAIPFGTLMSFDVTFSGAALNPPAPYPASGSDFSLLLSDSTGNPIWTTDPQDRVLDIPLNPNGTFGTAPYSLSSVATVSAAPEPSSWAAIGAGAALLLGLAVRARRLAGGAERPSHAGRGDDVDQRPRRDVRGVPRRL